MLICTFPFFFLTKMNLLPYSRTCQLIKLFAAIDRVTCQDLIELTLNINFLSIMFQKRLYWENWLVLYKLTGRRLYETKVESYRNDFVARRRGSAARRWWVWYCNRMKQNNIVWRCCGESYPSSNVYTASVVHLNTSDNKYRIGTHPRQHANTTLPAQQMTSYVNPQV